MGWCHSVVVFLPACCYSRIQPNFVMKRWIPFTSVFLLIVVATAEVRAGGGGYETVDLPGSSTTLIGMRLHSTPLAAGSVDISGTALMDVAINFDTFLTLPAEEYLVELDGGLSDGKMLPLVGYALNTIVVGESLPVESGVSYEIRRIERLSELIHPMTPQATSNFNPDNADLIMVPKGGGQFDQYYVSSFTSVAHPTEYLNVYMNAETGEVEDPLIFPRKGLFYVRRAASATSVVIAGDLRIANTLLPVVDRFNYFSSIYPVAETLLVSDLESSVLAGTAETADLVCLPDGAGGFMNYFYSDGTAPLTTGWRLVDAPPGSENTEQELVEMPTGFAILRRSPSPYEALMKRPSFYDGL